MLLNPTLPIGGSGAVGREAARFLPDAHPDLPLLIGARYLDKASHLAASLGNADALVPDIAADNLGLDGRPVSAVAIFFTDAGLASLRFAQTRGVPYISISALLSEIGPEFAAYMRAPDAAPIVLGAERLVGATTVPTLRLATEFNRIDDIAIGPVSARDSKGFEPAACFGRIEAMGGGISCWSL